MKKIIFLFLILFLSLMKVGAESTLIEKVTNTGSITINKYDIDGKERIKAYLSNSIFGIYKNRKLIKELKIGDSKTVTLTELAFGEYMVKEIQSGTGYDIDPKEYIIILDENNNNVILNSYSKVIEGNLVINKYYGDDNNYKLDEDAVFEIYNNNKIIKKVNNSGEIKLEYGDYLVRQISGKKCYDFTQEFSISIQQNKEYKYDLYTEKITEIKEYEDLLKQREEELKKWERDIQETNKNLIKLKEEIDNKNEEFVLLENELNKKETDLNSLENDLEKDKNEINKLKEAIAKEYEELENKTDELKKQEEELKKVKEGMNSKKEELNKKEESLKEMENTINQKEKEITETKKELESLSNKLNEKEKNLIELEKGINDKEMSLKKIKEQLNLLNKELSEKESDIKEKEEQLIQKEKDLIKLENKKEDVLVVEVPNTYKKNYNKLISIILLFVGSIFIIYSKKKVTNH